ncbi:unnamed protein product [Vicia faba]|uniref:Uncharacterized protein n=1 Tax=Vicia faba TaxID=3906 RepID=A0AAV0ZLF0_VICFA|nr:unnamed protein product [Vicia faba]
MAVNSNIIQVFCNQEARKKHKVMLVSKAPLPISRCLSSPEVDIPEEEPASAMNEQTTEATASEMVEFENSSAEDGSPYVVLKTTVTTEMPHGLKETLEELKKTNTIILQRLDKQDQWIEEHSSLSNLMKEIIARQPPPPPPNP